ncbi:MAG: hypothetical protein EHM70_25090 [Chloroflexota bacterium]|nr:MAG: hypothetical protein EHM70_25090 [Chloroflexota bacterium]
MKPPRRLKSISPIWQIRAFLERFVIGERKWGQIRFYTIGLAVAAIMVLNTFLLEGSTTTLIALRFEEIFPRLVIIPFPILKMIAGLLTLKSWRYLIAPLAVLIWASLVAGRYVQDIYGLASYRKSLKYVTASMFGRGYPHMTISGGKKLVKENESHLLDVIGGPGYLTIEPGNVVLFENLRGPSGIRDSGWHFIPRFEKVKEIVSLEEQVGELAKLYPMTKDGIEVELSDVRFRYRLLPDQCMGGFTGRSMEKPYPYSKQSVLNMAYNRNVTANGLASWQFTVNFLVENGVTDYINKSPLDKLAAPLPQNPEDPRAEIYEGLRSKGFREKLKDRGAELIWCDIGHFGVKDEQVSEQRLNTWIAKWDGMANIERSYGEAERLKQQEVGRAEAQSEMLVSIVNALDDIGLQGDSRQNLRSLILLRTAQLLDTMSEPGRPAHPGDVESPA